jgi:hypothetical protein
MKPTLPGARRLRALQALMLAIGLTALTGQAKDLRRGPRATNEMQAKRWTKLTGIDAAIIRGRGRDP